MRRLVRKPEVLDVTGLKPSGLRDAIRRGAFPATIRLLDGGRAIAWLEDELDLWLEARMAQREHREP